MSDEPKPIGNLPEFVQVTEAAARPVRQSYELRDTLMVLSKDMQRCNPPLAKNPKNQFWRRTLIRNLFALVEAQMYRMKQIAVTNSDIWSVQFSAAEKAMMREEKYGLKDSGEAYSNETNYPTFLANVKFAFKIFANAQGHNVE